MKILLLDIETSPISGFFWGLFKVNIGINQIVDTSRTLCIAYKWLGEAHTHFLSEWTGTHENMVRAMHAILEEADVVITYNGNRFDIPTLNKEFILLGLSPPAPYKSLDLFQTVRSEFRFASNKLDFITKALGLDGKLGHSGFQLWVDVMNGVASEQKVMQDYNIKDVTLLEELYFKVRPWIKMHPNYSHFTGNAVCPKCGSDKLRPRGTFPTAVGPKQRYRCDGCGGWSHATRVLTKGDITKRIVNI